MKLDLSKYIGEATSYDKKEKLEINKPKSWLKSVSAFANGRGGKLIFGVKEDNTILGLDDYHKDSENISEIIKTRMDSVPEFDMEIQEIEEKVILILSVYPGKNTPYFVIDSGSRSAYKRVGNQSVPATRIDLFTMSLKGQRVTYDSLESDKKIQDVTFKELAIEYNNKTSKKFEEKDLISFGLVNEEGHLTITGSLFADGYQVYQSRVFCTRWNGLTKANGLMDALDDQEFEGNIIYLLKTSMDFVKRNSKKSGKKSRIIKRYTLIAVIVQFGNALLRLKALDHRETHERVLQHADIALFLIGNVLFSYCRLVSQNHGDDDGQQREADGDQRQQRAAPKHETQRTDKRDANLYRSLQPPDKVCFNRIHVVGERRDIKRAVLAGEGLNSFFHQPIKNVFPILLHRLCAKLGEKYPVQNPSQSKQRKCASCNDQEYAETVGAFS